MKSKIIIGVAAVALVTLMVGNVYACVGPGLSPGFWKHNLGVYLTGGTNYSDPGYPAPCPSKEGMAAFFAQWNEATLEGLYDDLCTRGGGVAGNADRVSAANVFNAAADLYDY